MKVECQADDEGLFANVDAAHGFATLPISGDCKFSEHTVRITIGRDPYPIPEGRQVGPTSFEMSAPAGGSRGQSFPVDLRKQTRPSNVRGVSCDATPQGNARSVIGVVDERSEPNAVDAACRLKGVSGGWVDVAVHVVARSGEAR